MKQVGDVDQGDKEGEGKLLIKRDTLIQLHCKRGGLLLWRTTGCCVLLQNGHFCEKNQVCLEQEVE